MAKVIKSLQELRDAADSEVAIVGKVLTDGEETPTSDSLEAVTARINDILVEAEETGDDGVDAVEDYITTELLDEEESDVEDREWEETMAALDKAPEPIQHTPIEDIPLDDPEVEAEDTAFVTTAEEVEELDPMDRKSILLELETLYSTLRIPYVSKTWDNMETTQLYDLLSIVRKDAGGSVEVATLIQQTKEDFEIAMSSDMMRSRLKIVDQKSADHSRVIQRMNSLLGSDVVINGARTKEYHELVREYVKYIVTLTQKINSLAQFFNINLPVEPEIPNGPSIPVAEDMPCSPVHTVFILNVLMATMDRTVTASKFAADSLDAANRRIAYLEAQVRQANERYDSLQKHTQLNEAETRRLMSDASNWIIKDNFGRILRKKDPSQPISSPHDLDLNGYIDDALFFTTARNAEIMAERLMKSRRFRKRTLNTFRVSIVQQTFNERKPDDDSEATA